MLRVQSLVVLAGAALCATGSAWADQPATSSDEIRATVNEVLSDAESRTSLLAGGDAGHDNRGFFIAGDGFRLNVGGLLQFRYVLNFRDDVNADEFQPGFQDRR